MPQGPQMCAVVVEPYAVATDRGAERAPGTAAAVAVQGADSLPALISVRQHGTCSLWSGSRRPSDFAEFHKGLDCSR